MKILVDMNLSPTWCPVLEAEGHVRVHWSAVGERGAADSELVAWARESGFVVFTHDLDFGAILAASAGATAPSVIQVRGQDVMPQTLGPAIVAVLRDYEAALDAGALVVLDPHRARVRLLPLGR